MESGNVRRRYLGAALIAAIAALCLALIGCSGGSRSSSSSAESGANDEKAAEYVITEYSTTYGGLTNKFEYDRDDSGNIVSVKNYVDDVLTAETSYEFDSEGVYTSRTVTRYTEDGAVDQSSKVDLDSTLNSDKLPTEVTYSTERVDYADGTFTLPSDYVMTYSYAGGREVQQTLVSKSDSSDDLTSVSSSEINYDEDGFTLSYSYGSHQEDADGTTVEQTYTMADGTEQSTSNEYTYVYQYNEENEVNISDGDENIILSLEFDDDGNLTTVSDPDGNVIATYTWKKIDSPSTYVKATCGLVGDSWYRALIAQQATQAE